MRNRISNHKSPNVYLFLLSGREPLYPKLEIPQRLRSRVGESNQVSTRSRLNGTLGLRCSLRTRSSFLTDPTVARPQNDASP